MLPVVVCFLRGGVVPGISLCKSRGGEGLSLALVVGGIALAGQLPGEMSLTISNKLSITSTPSDLLKGCAKPKF